MTHESTTGSTDWYVFRDLILTHLRLRTSSVAPNLKQIRGEVRIPQPLTDVVNNLGASESRVLV